MLVSSIVPVPNNVKKSLCSTDNYRSIAIGSILSKVLDNIVIEKHASTLSSSSLQFRFKPKHSTIQCSFAVQEVIEHFVQRWSECHVLLLDASRAFDRVNYIKLFQLLISRKMCPLTINLLLQMYTNQSLTVTWNGFETSAFRCRNGVKQGGVLSPLLFCVYVDELLCRLKMLNCGCYIGNHFVGSFGYADDLTILAPSLASAQRMLACCETFAQEHDVLFNASKSAHLCILKSGIHNSVSHLSLNNIPIPKVDRAVLLGTGIGHMYSETNISKAVSDITFRSNILLARFGFCCSTILTNLFRTYCTSLYGSPLWPLDSNSLSRLNIAWKRCIKRIWKISPRCHSNLLPLVSKVPPLQDLLLSRFVTFSIGCLRSCNPVVRFLFSVANHSHSVVGSNIRTLLSTLSLHNANQLTVKHKAQINSRYFYFCDDDLQCLAIAIRDLCDMRDSKDFAIFSLNEIIEFTNFLCTS